MSLLPGVREHVTPTARLRVRWLEHGPEDGVPVVLLHGNLSTSRFWEHQMPGAPDRYRVIAPDMRGFGDTEPLALDATRGLRDWSDDLRALLDALDVHRPVHLAGWSTGGAAIAAYAEDHGRVASLTFVDPVSPWGFGGVGADGTPNHPDHAGSGGGTGNPDVVRRIAEGDASADAPTSPRNVMNALYWRPEHREPPEREEVLVAELLKTLTGDDGYPGDVVTSPHWPGVAPGRTGILNALSGRYCDWSTLPDLAEKPPVLWTHGGADLVIADRSPLDLAVLGADGTVPGWPGEEEAPAQPMVAQISAVLDRYAEAGGHVEREWFAGSGHGPHFDEAQAWAARFWGFVDAAEG